MRIQNVSLMLLAALLVGCATTPSKTARRSTRPVNRRSIVRNEIAKEITNELANPERDTHLLGPITEERLAQIEKERSVRPSILGDLLAQKGLSRARAVVENEPPPVQLKTLSSLETSHMRVATSSNETPFIFDIPVTYNNRVSNWIRWFQTDGRQSFKTWLERSSRYVPEIENELRRAGLPQDLVYLAMIESGFRPDAASHMGAIGLWQFIAPTARHYGLNISWWIDERRDFAKSTKAAIAYMKELNGEFNSWYLVAASYNMGETGVRRLIKRHATNNFWDLADKHVLPRETTDYVPKIIAATLIAKAPALYGFRDLDYQVPLSFDTVRVPGGTDLVNLAGYLGVSGKYLMELNPELTRGFIPREVRGHQIRVPKGSTLMVSQYVRMQQQQASDYAPGVTQEAAN
jgi:membrane-bound lytic murein transglycosylase D